MSKQVLISLLAQGNNGNEILSILDTLAADAVSDTEEGDLADWWYSGGATVWHCGTPYVMMMRDTVWQWYAGGLL